MILEQLEAKQRTLQIQYDLLELLGLTGQQSKSLTEDEIIVIMNEEKKQIAKLLVG